MKQVPMDFQDISLEEVRELVHDLQTHQIELETQNKELRLVQDELVKSRNRYSNLYDTAPVGYATLSHEGLILNANLTLSKMLDLERPALTKQPFSAFIIQNDQDILYHHYRKILESKQRNTCRIRMLRRNAEPFWVQMDSILIGADNKSDAQLQTVISDITEQKRAEENLQASEKQRRLILDASVDMIFYVDLEMRIIWSNKEAWKCIDLSSLEELVGSKCHEVYMKTEKPCPYCPCNKSRETGSIEGSIYHQTNFTSIGHSWWENTCVPTLDDSGQVIGTTVIARNITERKNAEIALRQERDKAQQYLDIAGVILVAINDKGEVALINKKGCEILDYSEKEIIGKNWFDNFIPKWLKDKLLPVSDKLLSGELKPVEYYENPILTRSGEERIIAWHNSILKDETGKVIGHLSSGEDITERKMAQDALQRSERWLSTTLNSIGDAVITTDMDGTISFLNPVASALTGWELEEAENRPLTDVFNVISEETLDPIENPVSKVLREKNVVGFANHTMLISKDGTRRPIADSGAPITDDDGNILGVVLVFRDITKAREQEAALRHHQKLQSIGTLASGVAHEINNPLNGIMNYGELIRIRLDPASPLVEFANGVVEESQRISVIVRNLLTFSRQDKEAHSPVNIADIVNATLSLTVAAFRKDQINVTLDIPDYLPKVKCRSQQIVQVLTNLLNNARDALNQRYSDYDDNKVVTIRIQPFKKEDNLWLRTTVEDHGIGISRDISDLVFDPFYTTKPRDQGTGLGLSVSHGIVKEHGGGLWFESMESEYTRFHLDLQVDNALTLETPDGVAI
ncbi:MAG: PAS domain S-box protein [Proteobacteria bacterium]|nr:PAS domain S-box protein [Pseudomonadota bacterium]